MSVSLQRHGAVTIAHLASYGSSTYCKCRESCLGNSEWAEPLRLTSKTPRPHPLAGKGIREWRSRRSPGA